MSRFAILTFALCVVSSAQAQQVIIIRQPTPQELEAQTRVTLNDWVKLYLGRKATADELTQMVTRINRGASNDTIQASLLSSAEYWKLAGGNAPGFVRKLFKDTQGREATPAEVLKLAGQVNLNRNQFVTIYLQQISGK